MPNAGGVLRKNGRWEKDFLNNFRLRNDLSLLEKCILSCNSFVVVVFVYCATTAIVAQSRFAPNVLNSKRGLFEESRL
jgi:hypothetical protein